MPDDQPAEPCHRDALVQAANDLLQPARFKDYGPNGLQVEGKPQVRRLVSGVTASLALIDAAIEQGADAILVIMAALAFANSRATSRIVAAGMPQTCSIASGLKAATDCLSDVLSIKAYDYVFPVG